MVKYYLLPARLGNPKKGEKVARTEPKDVVVLDEMITRMANKGNTLTRTDILANLNSFFEEVAAAIGNGEQLSFPLFKTSFSVKGVFQGMEDQFDKNRHSLSLNITPGSVMKNELSKVVLEKTVHQSLSTQLIDFVDTATGITNEVITSGAFAKLKGNNIKVEGDPDETGIFFINITTAEEVKVVFLGNNLPSTLDFVIPALVAGEWGVEVRTFFSGGAEMLKTLQISRLSDTLVVA